MTDQAPETKIEATQAGLLRRLGAMLYDGLLLLAIFFATGFIWVIPTGQAASGPLFQLILLLEIVLFYGYCWYRTGETLGMRAWRLRLVNDQGLPASLKQIGVRLLVAPISMGCFGLGYLWIYVSPSGKTWHDHLSQTLVAHLPR
ncbi:MAG: RDD family protein [Gammaproteobacteria bacterium TMED134]|nr:MAG: RDD family protein [Gammaproteobacteria bacterium TMED134]RZO72204.1 MAG: RDD family protein [OM182 bacterium]HBK17477.1 RDD family protein [Gammaproteobacteria bacterium]|tara:strand:+ start:5946 stop:6380 length:435 start_codon:yes stop_codon:yes gene_type:complete